MLARVPILRGGAAIRTLGSCLASVLFGLALGCSSSAPDGYEPHLRYAGRTDPIVLAAPTEQPTTAPDPLMLTEFFADLPKRGAKVVLPGEVPEAQREQVKQALDALFGTPAAPAMPEGIAAVGALALDSETLAAGSASYRVRCSSCHGMTGDGRGSGAKFPYPRDFRAGLFKRTTGTAANGKPRVEDLHRVIRSGIPGAAMPMFDLIPEESVAALAAYVVHLSIRGEVEVALLRRLHPDSEDGITEVNVSARKFAETSHRQWLEAQAAGPKHTQPALEGETQAESIRRGHAVFVKNACLTCHEGYGRKETYRYDAWGLPNRVRDLTQPEYRWGREPADLARAVQHGIKPANMPAVPLKENELADLVNFLRVLPFAAQLPPDVRGAVEGGPR